MESSIWTVSDKIPLHNHASLYWSSIISYMLCIDIRSSYIYKVFSPPLKVIQYFEHDLIEIHDRIFDFYPGVPHMHVMYICLWSGSTIYKPFNGSKSSFNHRRLFTGSLFLGYGYLFWSVFRLLLGASTGNLS